VLVRRAIDEGLPVTMLPGPTGLVMALVLSGLPSHSFTYRGFPPRKPGARKRFFAQDAASPYTLIYYESPHRLVKALADALGVLGDRPAALANDLTKLYEAVWRGSLSELLARAQTTKLLGEFILVVAGAEEGARAAEAEADEGADDEADSEDGPDADGGDYADA
jgi:16S rRNA (cytidine1402-2'-O)-methyltransferase